MSEQEFKEKMNEGYKKVHPIVMQITSLVMDAYQEGFNNCWEILTGQKMEDKNDTGRKMEDKNDTGRKMEDKK